MRICIVVLITDLYSSYVRDSSKVLPSQWQNTRYNQMIFKHVCIQGWDSWFNPPPQYMHTAIKA